MLNSEIDMFSSVRYHVWRFRTARDLDNADLSTFIYFSRLLKRSRSLDAAVVREEKENQDFT